MDPREKKAKSVIQRQKQELLDKAYSQLIESQLHAISKKKKTADEDEERYREELAKERERALANNANKRKRNKRGSSADDGIHSSGLSGS
jgi:hypothetical protein